MSSTLVAAVVNGGIVSAMLALAVTLLFRFSGRRFWNASTRYAVWFVLLIVTMVLPLFYLPIHLPVPRWMRGIPSSSAEVSAATANPPQGVAPMAKPASATRTFTTQGTDQGRLVTFLPVFPVEVPAGNWTFWVLCVWLTACAFMLLRLLASCILLHRWKARAQTIPALASTSSGEFLRHCGSRRRVRLGTTSEIAAPVAAGPFRPSILIPSRLFEEMGDNELRQIGLHEAAHFARRDDYGLLFQRLCEAVFVFHPVVRWIVRRLELEREIACDDVVVSITGQAGEYAECLARVVELSIGGFVSPLAAPATETRSVLEKRLNTLLDKQRQAGTAISRSRLAALTVAFAAAVWFVPGGSPFILLATAPALSFLGPTELPLRALPPTPGLEVQMAVFPLAMSPQESSPMSPMVVALDQYRGMTDNVRAAVEAAQAALDAMKDDQPFVVLEYASIQPSRLPLGTPEGSCHGSDSRFTAESARRAPPLGHCILERRSLKGLIGVAYQVYSANGVEAPRKLDDMVIGTQPWHGSAQNPAAGEFFDVVLKAADTSVTEEQLYRVLQLVLVDRFKLELHREVREISGYALTVDNKSKLRLAAGCTKDFDTGLRGPGLEGAKSGHGLSVAALSRYIVASLDRPILDKTGLKERYDFNLTYMATEHEIADQPRQGMCPSRSGPTIFDALQEQTGLRLEPQTIPMEVIVIDSAERPCSAS